MTHETVDQEGQPVSTFGGLRPFTVSVEIALTPVHTDVVALMTGTPVHEISQHLDHHLQRGTE